MKKILLIAVGLFIVMQFIPYGRDHTNPSVIKQVKWDSPKTKALFDRACADCHSNETKWPWYSNIAPLSWSIYYHVAEGREHFNVSMWGVQKKNKGDEAAEEVEKGEMPLASYLIAHPEARLTKEEKQALISGLKNTFGSEKDEDEE
ncbi:heme-binding domain-containing protein [Sulfurimonas sp. SWIR-19]|uniref:heme-binding domain-containing protein n=1 Tax=Sulfurimonas sp. SWIR-19 TaxID=2878390 RepID=UPI001CF1529A|nr:heme-binding domain-containing protein [Sulfurimonas sp. SWIR-19]UCN01329.1 heme-binding domain-containing protein [Sulfurimonas sp. SWIR-19]